MDILVTGGSGFVGTNFIHYILDKYPDYNVICVDIKNKNNFLDIEDNDRFSFCFIDVCNYEEMLKIFKFWFSFDVIINFVSESTEDTKELISSNIVSVCTLLDIVKKFKVKKFLQVSSDEVYDANQKSVETSLLKPENLFSATKASADLLALSYFSEFKIPVIISRSSSSFGPFQNPNIFIPQIITDIIENKEIILSDTYNKKDWLNVLDYCRVLETLIHYGKPGEIYNSSCENETENDEIAQFIINYMGLPESVLNNVVDRQNNRMKHALDCSKIRKEFGWTPKLEFKESLIDTIEWYKENQEWWRKLKTK